MFDSLYTFCTYKKDLSQLMKWILCCCKMEDVGCRSSQQERLFLEEKNARRKGQLEGKETCVREACEACMQGRPNDTRVRVFIMYCNDW